MDIANLEEVQLLEAMFLDEFKLDKELRQIGVELKPNTGMDDSKIFVQCKLVITLSPKYPKEIPTLSITNYKGMQEDNVQAMLKILHEKAKLMIGSPMIFEILELGKEILTANNIPKSDCIICLNDFNAESTLPFMKTHCFHYFHKLCLARWYLSSNLHRNKNILCPTCREPLTQKDIQQLEENMDSIKEEIEQEEQELEKELNKLRKNEDSRNLTLDNNEKLNHENNVANSRQSRCVKIIGLGKGDLPQTVLSQACNPFGAVGYFARIPSLDPKNTRRGSVIIEFPSENEAQLAVLNLHHTTIGGQIISCEGVESQ